MVHVVPLFGVPFSNKALYADHIAQKAVFLGLPELAMLCMARQKDMLILFWDDETGGDPIVRPLLQIFNELLESNPGTGKFEVNEQMDMNSSTLWITAAVRCDFKRGNFWNLNHFMPAYPKVQLGEEWQTAVQGLQDCHASCAWKDMGLRLVKTHTPIYIYITPFTRRTPFKGNCVIYVHILLFVYTTIYC